MKLSDGISVLIDALNGMMEPSNDMPSLTVLPKVLYYIDMNKI